MSTTAASKQRSSSSNSRYRSIRAIRDTLFGQIWLGHDTETDNLVVIKVYLKSAVSSRIPIRPVSGSARNEPVQENVVEELKIHTMISNDRSVSPYINILLDIVVDHKYIYAILEHCPNGDLFDFLIEQRERSKFESEAAKHIFAERQAKRYMRQIMDAVHYLHNQGIVHRDLSLENLVLDANHDAKLIDFGVAFQYQPDPDSGERSWTSQAGRIGKLSYMAPEVFSGRSYDGRQADIWSCGVMMFVLLIGAPPYQVPDTHDPRFEHIVGGNLRDLLSRWELEGQFSDHALDLLQRMLLPADHRIQMEDILAHEWFQSDDLVPVSPRSPANTSRPVDE